MTLVGSSAFHPINQRYKAVYVPGEEIKYRVHYGFLTAGEAYMRITENYFKVNNKVCFRSEIVGNSVGAFDKIIRIRDVWGSYFDTVHFMPQKSFRSIAENRYRKREEVYYDYDKNLATIKVENDPEASVKITSKVQDMVSGYYFLRLQNYDSFQKNDTMKLKGIFEDKTYDFDIVYLGKTKVKTRFGKIKAFLISPVMPTNTLFSGANPIRMWISDDQNRIPIKIEAELLLGSIDMDITNYSKLKYPLSFEK